MKMIKLLLFMFLLTGCRQEIVCQDKVVYPEAYEHALANPMKGFRTDKYDGSHPWSRVSRVYIRWNQIEQSEDNTLEDILQYCDQLWQGIEKLNIKVIPRVYLHWEDEDQKYWPDDIEVDDYSSERFKNRLKRLIIRLGEAWDNDPRVAWIQMGFIGKWGEHHSPDVSIELQQLMGDAFSTAFKNKKVTIRHPWDFEDYEFGIYWDSFGHIQEIPDHGKGIEKLDDRWKISPIAGEVAYNWGDYPILLGNTPTHTLSEDKYRKHLSNWIRRLHAINLGWVSNYDTTDERALRGAEEVQKILGYRFVINRFQYPCNITPGEEFNVDFSVVNVGSSPFYYNWPVEISLLDKASGKRVWHDFFTTDIRRWLPGELWDEQKQIYTLPADTIKVTGKFKLPAEFNKGEYYISLAVCDPAGMMPALRFAIKNYFMGGLHPMGIAGVGQKVKQSEIAEDLFDEPQNDKTLRYRLNN